MERKDNMYKKRNVRKGSGLDSLSIYKYTTISYIGALIGSNYWIPWATPVSYDLQSPATLLVLIFELLLSSDSTFTGVLTR
ncbi:hypothetical protein EJ110_NYTH34431 [Nymphaea thermarum]|nr:hypothetical protein EJ110_NYTH34431 [Nymphaea thermarum]